MANTLQVGAGQQYQTLSSAVAASHNGDTIDVAAGTYTNDWAAINHDLNIVGVGGYAHFVSTAPIDNGKADLVTNGNVTVQNLEFSGAHVADGNGAGIRYESGNLSVINSYFHDNQDGILGAPNASGNISIQNSTFTHNGAGDGGTHGIYIGQIASLTVDGSIFQDTFNGNQLKSRAASTTVTNSHFITGPDGANYDIDLPNGGAANIHGNTFDKGIGTNNPAIIHFGGETATPTGSLTVDNNSFTSEIGNATAVLNQTSLPVEMSGNTLSGVAHVELGGAANIHDNVITSTTPSSVTPALMATIGPVSVAAAPSPTPAPAPTPTTPAPVATTTDSSGSGSTVAATSPAPVTDTSPAPVTHHADPGSGTNDPSLQMYDMMISSIQAEIAHDAGLSAADQADLAPILASVQAQEQAYIDLHY